MRASHPGFDKAAELLGGVKVVRLFSNGPVGLLRCAAQLATACSEPVRLTHRQDYAADMVGLCAAIGPATVMMVGSAPSYPYGISDDIAAMSALALRVRCFHPPTQSVLPPAVTH